MKRLSAVMLILIGFTLSSPYHYYNYSDCQRIGKYFDRYDWDMSTGCTVTLNGKSEYMNGVFFRQAVDTN